MRWTIVALKIEIIAVLAAAFVISLARVEPNPLVLRPFIGLFYQRWILGCQFWSNRWNE
jgi:hypothetical protein